MDKSILVQQMAGATLVGFGCFFDLLSFIALIQTLRGKFSSGFPFVGGLFYLIFTIGALFERFRLGTFEHPAALGFLLICLHVLIQYVHYRVSRKQHSHHGE
jgi:hypothetical protein